MYREKLKYVSGFFEKNIINNTIVCPSCHIKHTGRNAYAIKLFLYLHLTTQENKYFDLAYMLAKNTMDSLQSPPESDGKYKVFYPGLYAGSQNNSSNVIDSGISTDMVSEFLLYCVKYKINLKENDAWIQELRHHIQNYLVHATLHKVCLNQRLWGLTAIATFYKLTKDESLKQHIQDSLKQLFSEQNGDGSFEYIVNKETIDAKFSLYYLPRLLAFAQYCMDSINEYHYITQMSKATTLLLDCYDHNYNKLLDIENKKWFFTASYEVESLVYDIFLLKSLQNYCGFDTKKIYQQQIEYYMRHINEHGVQSNKENKPNLCCAFIDNSDFIWLIRAFEIQYSETKKVKYQYEKHNRDYVEAGISVAFLNDKKIITLSNQDSFNCYWGVKHNLRIVVTKDKTMQEEPKHFYRLQIHPNFKYNLQNFRNIFHLSAYNITYTTSRIRYLCKMFVLHMKYNILDNGWK